MKKAHILWFLAGWLLSLFFGPQVLLNLFKSVTANHS